MPSPERIDGTPELDAAGYIPELSAARIPGTQLPAIQARPERDGHDVAARLPDATTLTPTGEAIPSALDQLFGYPSLDAVFADAFRPRTFEPDILQPGRFHTLLGQAARAMSSRTNTHGHSKPIWAAAAQVLEEEQELQDLFEHNLHALHEA
jgi:hypothetical protein